MHFEETTKIWLRISLANGQQPRGPLSPLWQMCCVGYALHVCMGVLHLPLEPKYEPICETPELQNQIHITKLTSLAYMENLHKINTTKFITHKNFQLSCFQKSAKFYMLKNFYVYGIAAEYVSYSSFSQACSDYFFSN